MTMILDEPDGLTIHLSQYEADMLRRPVQGYGKILSLIRQLQLQLNYYDNTLLLTKKQIDTIREYEKKYSSTNAYQNRLKMVAKYLLPVTE